MTVTGGKMHHVVYIRWGGGQCLRFLYTESLEIPFGATDYENAL